MRGGEKLELPQPMLPGLQQPRPPPHHLHPPPPHRAWEQLGQLYESHLPPQGHSVVPLPNEHSLRLHNGGYTGSGGPPPNPHHPPSRPNQLLKVSNNATDLMACLPEFNCLSQIFKNGCSLTVSMLSLPSALVWGSSGAACSPGSTIAGR